MRRDEPPEVPTLECIECGSPEVTRESLEHGVALCTEHDGPVRRRHIELERRIGDLEEANAHVMMRMSREAGGKTREHLNRIRRKGLKRLEAQRSELAGLQEMCDHSEMEEHEQRGRVGGPVAVMERCALCGMSEWRDP